MTLVGRQEGYHSLENVQQHLQRLDPEDSPPNRK